MTSWLAVGCKCTPPAPDAVWGFPLRHGADCILVRRSFSALVLGVAMKILGNPIVLRMGLGLLAAIFAFVMGMMMMRRMRRSLIEEASLDQGPSTPERFPLHTYHAVIQQLKQQKHELMSEQ